MKKFLLLLFIALFNLACLQTYAQAELSQSQASQATNANMGNQERVLALHKANIHDMVTAHGQRVEDLQFQQMQFLIILCILVALIIAVICLVVYSRFKSFRKEIDDQKELINEKLKVLDNTIKTSNDKIKTFQHDLNSFLRQAKDKIDNQTDVANQQIAEQLNGKLQEAKKKLGEIANQHNKVSELVKEIEDKKGALTPELKKRVIDQVEEIKKTKSEDEYTAYDWLLKGEEASEKKKYEEAADCYQKATELDPNNATYFNNWGYVLEKLSKHREAIIKFEKAIEKNPSDATYYNNIGYSYASIGENDKAIENLEKAVTQNTQYAAPYRHWAGLLVKQGQYLQAADKFGKAVELKADYKKVYPEWEKAVEEQKAGDAGLYEYMVKEFKEVLQKNKDMEDLKSDKGFQKIYSKYFPS